MTSGFFALIARTKYILRWGLMRNAVPENLQEHSYMTAVLAHALAVIRRDVFHVKTDPDAYATAALFHDAGEILTGDLPTPVKYFNPELRRSYAAVEASATDRLLGMLPDALRATYSPLLKSESDAEVLTLVRAADKLSAYIKCVEELRLGNTEFRKAALQTRAALDKMELREVEYFIENFLPAFELTLDEI